MNIKSLIRPELWLAISNTYEAENYSPAIVDAMHYLSEVIREKSGLDGDGHAIVGAAFGGQNPVLRVNKLQTETERNVQKGVEQILRGMYQGIRNPRSHEQINDTKSTADAIIYFINYLLGVISQAQEPFTIASFLDRVFDKHFVKSAKYSSLLVAEIPPGKYLDVVVEIYRRKKEGNRENLALVVKDILKVMTETQIAEFALIISDELKSIQNETDISRTLQLINPELWKLINPVARMRAENILLQSIQEGEADSKGKTNGGALGTWANDFLQYFESKNRARSLILQKIRGRYSERIYIFTFFLPNLPSLFDESQQKDKCIQAICNFRFGHFGYGF